MRKKIIYIIVVMLVGYSFYGVTYSKYAANSIWDYYLKSKGFYFTSDQLSNNTIMSNANNLWNGESVPFSIKNSLNQEVITQYDINYQVECSIEGDQSVSAACLLNGTNLSTASGVLSSSHICTNTTDDGVDVSKFNQSDCETNHYQWVSQIAVGDLYFDVVPSDPTIEITDVIVNVIATSTSPYNKTLNGRFILHRGITRDNIILDYKNFSNYDRLTIFNKYLTSKCVELSWDSSKLLVDLDTSNASYTMDNNKYINGIKFNINSKESINYLFHSRNKNVVYDVNEFAITESTNCPS